MLWLVLLLSTPPVITHWQQACFLRMCINENIFDLLCFRGSSAKLNIQLKGTTMKEKEDHLPSHARQVARRAFIRKTAVGAVLAMPAVESLTKASMLAKATLVSTGITWTITTQVQAVLPG